MREKVDNKVDIEHLSYEAYEECKMFNLKPVKLMNLHSTI